MTHADQILIEASQKIRDQVLTTADDLTFYELIQHLRDLEIWSGDLEALTGIDSGTVMNKYRVSAAAKAVEMGRDFPERYKDMAPQYSGKPLSGPDHEDRDWQNRWLDKCPAEYRTHVLERALNDPDAVTVLYHDILGRWPDQAGRDHYDKQLVDGRPRWEIVREIELSDEAQAE